METERSHYRSASIQGSKLQHLEPAHVHAGLRAVGQHPAATSVHADDAGIYRAAIGVGAHAGRPRDYGSAAARGIPVVALLAALAAHLWSGRALGLAIPHDNVQFAD